MVTNNTVGGSCSRCGSCCTGSPLPLTMSVAFSIWDYVSGRGIKQLNRSWVRSVVLGQPVEVVDTRCCFYDSHQGCCTIYDVRPSICRSFRCDLPQSVIDSNKAYHHSVAHYNGGSSGLLNLTNFDALFFGDFDALLLLIFFTGRREGLRFSLEGLAGVLRSVVALESFVAGRSSFFPAILFSLVSKAYNG